MGQLAKQLAEKPNGQFAANTKNNPKEECKAVLTRSQVRNGLDKNKSVGEVGEEEKKDEDEEERKVTETEKENKILEENKTEKNQENEK